MNKLYNTQKNIASDLSNFFKNVSIVGLNKNTINNYQHNYLL